MSETMYTKKTEEIITNVTIILKFLVTVTVMLVSMTLPPTLLTG